MTESLLIPPAGGAAQGDPHDPYRPAPPDRGPAAALRRIAGVNEDILDWVPEERARYTRLGAIIVNTGVLAALSLLVALGKVIDVPWPLLIPVALFWGYLVLSFDGWLVASTHGVLGLAKLRIFVPRLVISILMGAVIAEPLLLWIFAPAIHTEVRDQRKATIDEYESQLKRCNPTSGERVDAAECREFLLTIRNPPDSVRQELRQAQDERQKLVTLIAGINAELTRLETLARLECDGTKGAGLSGVVGQGPNCKRNRAQNDRYRVDSNLAQHQAALTALNERIVDLTGKESTASGTYAEQVNVAITEKVDDKRANQAKIGLLDEDRALGTLSTQSAFVFAGHWLLRLLLIAVDSLPVLTKLMSRTTTYDVLLSRQLEISSRLHDKHTTVREQRDIGRGHVEIQKNEHDVRSRIEEIDEANRAVRANRETVLDDQIERLAARLRDDPET